MTEAMVARGVMMLVKIFGPTVEQGIRAIFDGHDPELLRERPARPDAFAAREEAIERTKGASGR